MNESSQDPTQTPKRDTRLKPSGKLNTSPNWYQIRESYLRGEGSARELAERFEISEATLKQRCTREKWVIDKRQTYAFLVTKTADELSNLALDWRKEIVHRSKIAMAFLDQIHEEYRTGKRILNENGLLMLSRCAESIDGLMRRSLGIADKIEVKASEQDFHLIYLAQVKALKQIVAERNASGETNDRADRMLEVRTEKIE